jgi:hypothetical protein
VLQSAANAVPYNVTQQATRLGSRNRRKGRRMVVSIHKGASHGYRAQSGASRSDFGDLTGLPLSAVASGFHAPETARAIMELYDAAMDTMESQRLLVPMGPRLGRMTVARDHTVLVAQWDWITEPVTEPPPAIALEVRLDVMAEHLHRLAWALREGRPLPHVPATLRAGPGPR